MSDYVDVQVDNGGLWQTCRSCLNDSQYIKMEMENLKRIYPDRRIRCVDKEGRLIDLLY